MSHVQPTRRQPALRRCDHRASYRGPSLARAGRHDRHAGSPFGGSPWAGLLPFFEIVRALRRGSPLSRRLASTPSPDGVRRVSVTAALDIIVPGLRSVPFHSQVETITVNDVGHLGMLMSEQVIGCISAALCQQSAASAAEPGQYAYCQRPLDNPSPRQTAQPGPPPLSATQRPTGGGGRAMAA